METTANFSIHYQQYLQPDGKPKQALPAFASDAKQVVALYRGMLRVRALDDKAVKLQRMGKMGTYPSSLGQEAVAIGMGNALRKDDVLCPYYRDQGAMMEHGVTPAEILIYWGGDERGSDFANAREDFPICITISAQCLHATGVAYAMKLRKQQRAVLTACGDGGTSKGDFYEAMNLAGEWQLPVVFVVNNNQWAISVPREKQTHTETLAQKAVAASFEGVQVDGNDIIAVREITEKALDKARKGGGPTLIEAITYRLCDHTTADDATRYVDKKVLEEAWKNEPLIRLRAYMMEQGFLTEADDKKMHDECKAEIESAVEEYLNVAPSEPQAMFEHLYAELPGPLKEQRDRLVNSRT